MANEKGELAFSTTYLTKGKVNPGSTKEQGFLFGFMLEKTRCGKTLFKAAVLYPHL